MNRHSLDKKCLHQTPSPLEEENIRRGALRHPCPLSARRLRSLPPTTVFPSGSPFLFTRVSSLRLYAPRVLRKNAVFRSTLPRFTSCFLPPLCLFFASLAFPLWTPSLIHILLAMRVAPSPLFTSHNSSLPHFSSIIPHYYFAPTHCFLSSSLVPHPPSSLHVFPILSINSLQCDNYPLPHPTPPYLPPFFPPLLMNSSPFPPFFPNRST